MIQKILPVLLIISTLLIPNSGTFSGVGIITTGWRELVCSERCYNTRLVLNSVVIDSSQEEITPNNISWDVIDYQGNQYNEVNVTSVSFAREIDIDPLNFSYRITVWADEDYSLVTINLSRFDSLHIPSVTIPPTSLDPTNETKILGVSEFFSFPLVLFLIWSFLFSRRKNSKRKSQKLRK